MYTIKAFLKKQCVLPRKNVHSTEIESFGGGGGRGDFSISLSRIGMLVRS